VLVRSRTLSRGVSKILDEFDNYFREPTVLNEKGKFYLDFSPCEYWKLNQHRFPALAPIAKDIMEIPCSSANIEPSFKTADHILSAERKKPNPELLQCLCSLNLMLNFWKLSLTRSAIKNKFGFDFNLFEFPLNRIFRFPTLAPIAKYIMRIPRSSANIERPFSTAVDILSARRTSLIQNYLF
jgi:hAT family C-terminal dimerisation region